MRATKRGERAPSAPLVRWWVRPLLQPQRAGERSRWRRSRTERCSSLGPTTQLTDRPGAASGEEVSGRSRIIPSSPLSFSDQGLRSLRFACWSAALLLGALDACTRPFAMQAFGSCPDGVSYIDIAAAYGRG